MTTRATLVRVATRATTEVVLQLADGPEEQGLRDGRRTVTVRVETVRFLYTAGGDFRCRERTIVGHVVTGSAVSATDQVAYSYAWREDRPAWLDVLEEEWRPTGVVDVRVRE